MKKIIIIGGVLVAALAVSATWFWSLSALPEEAPLSIELIVERPEVEIQSKGEGGWRVVQGSATLSSGDIVRTGAAGRATLRLFDRAETRLRENSTLQVEQARDTGQGSAAAINLKLMGGRAWSRVLKLFDLDSEFTVRTDKVVATVRGTAFDLGADATGTSMLVTESVVEMVPEAKSFMVAEGYITRLKKNGTWSAPELLSPAETLTAWFTSNRDADLKFEQRIKAQADERLQLGRGALPDASTYALTRLSENWRLRLAGKGTAAMYGRLVERRLQGIKILIDQGKSGLAFQAMTVLEADVKNSLRGENGAAYRPHLDLTIAGFSGRLSDPAPSSPLYRLQQRVEDLFQDVAGADAARGLHARLSAVDARLSAATKLITANALEEAGVSLDAATQGIANVERDLQAAAPSLENLQAQRLHGKLAALKVWEAALRLRLSMALNPPAFPLSPENPEAESAPTSTSPAALKPAPTSTPSVPPTSTGSLNPPPLISEKPWDTITLTAQPNPVLAGGMVQLSVTGRRTDGSSADLTSRASFKLLGGLGSLNGPTFISNQAGSVTVEAAVMDNGTAKKAATVIQVNQPPVLSGLEIVPQGSTTVVAGGKVSLTAKAVYTGGFSSLVTPQVTWKTSDPNIGSAVNGVFTAWVNGQGSVTITGTYTENGVSKSASLVFNVVQREAGTATP